MTSFLDALRERVLIFDGAMGTQIQGVDLSLDDFWGQENNSEVLNVSRPDLIQQIHARYLEAGADCVETNTFGANLVVQAEYGAGAERVHELNVTAARLARAAASSFTDRPRFVVGAMGPGTQLPSLGHTTFDVLEESYSIQASALMEGGVDALLIETAQDLLQVKAAIAGAEVAFARDGRKVPLMVQVTIETTGTMLLGTEIGAVVTAIAPFDSVDSLGINCATGPVEMVEHVRAICQSWPKFVSVQPNAGLPQMREGKPYYGLTPEELLAHHEVFVREFGANAVGGCCGTTPAHIEMLARALSGHARPDRQATVEPGCASLYVAQPFRQATSFFVIGERANASGSRKFRNLIEAEDWEQTLQVARDQVREGAHALDVNVDFVGRDGVADMTAVISRYRAQVTIPVVLDSTEPEVIEAGLKLLGGRPLINSINLEEGRGPDTRLERNLRNARKYGAAVVAIAIDERGQATTAEWKLEACRAIYEVAVDEFGLKPWDIVFDCVVLPVSTGQEETRRAAIETLDGVEAVKKAFPDSFTSLGVSNVSFGLSPAARQVLNSVFLHEAVARGLDMAIVSPAQILPMNRIDERARRVALDVLYDRRTDSYDPLTEFVDLFEGVESQRKTKEDLSHLPVDERLRRRIVDGNRDGLQADLDEALGDYPALEIINRFLLDGMKTVGELFASGEMQLPFVLQSAEIMKAAVAHLEPHIERVEGEGKGTIVLATVKGDVHDIGKNLVDIILSNNGYTVFNLGIKQPVGSIIEAAERRQADAIGLSGLLVKSTVVMREDLEELNRRNLFHYPVILGGAALTRSYVEHDLRKIYRGKVFYGRDAFEGLRHMDALMAEKRGEATIEAPPKERRVRGPTVALAEPEPVRRSDVRTDVPVPTPPFWGTRVVKGIAVADIAGYLNKSALFRGRWEMRRRRSQSSEEYDRFIAETAEPTLRDLLARCVEERLLQPSVVYGYFPVQSDGQDLIVYSGQQSDEERLRFTFPRQTRDRRLSIPDFFRPVESGERDVLAVHLVTMGRRVSEAAHELFATNRYQEYFFLHGLSVEMAEALAEYWHKRIREELGIAGEDAPNVEALFDQGYRGSRYSFGYPACPDLEQQAKIFDLLEPDRIGVSLTEEFQLDPEQSTSALIVHHPEAKYFSVGRQV